MEPPAIGGVEKATPRHQPKITEPPAIGSAAKNEDDKDTSSGKRNTDFQKEQGWTTVSRKKARRKPEGKKIAEAGGKVIRKNMKAVVKIMIEKNEKVIKETEIMRVIQY